MIPSPKRHTAPPVDEPNHLGESTVAETAVDVRGIREKLGLTRAEFARFTGLSERALANWESGESVSPSSRRRLVEMERLQKGLSRAFGGNPRNVASWLKEPRPTLNGLKPLEVLERGQVDQIWQILYRVGADTE